MTCTIIIFHINDLKYLRGTVRQIERYTHPDIETKIIIADQSKEELMKRRIDDEFTPRYRVVHLPARWSGYSVDWILRSKMIDTEYICTLDCDAFPIHKNWLYVPLMLIENQDFDWVGVHAQIENHYAKNGEFFSMCMHFMVSTTKNFDEASYHGGFTKQDYHGTLNYSPTTWQGWSDDGVMAHWWVDQNRNHRKLGLAVSHYLGHAPTEGYFGRYTDGLVWHMGFSYTGRMVKDIRASMGDEFMAWMDKIRGEGLTDELIDDIIAKKIPLESPIPRRVWEDKHIISPSAELNEYIEQLKNS